MNEILPFVTMMMDLEGISQTNTNIFHLYMESKKKSKEKHNKTGTESQIQRTNRCLSE